MRRVLLIAYQFPPFTGSSGVQRAFRFACHLTEFGWEPIVLTAHPRAYERRSDELLQELPDGIPVIRAPAWDAQRHFSVAGRYPGFLARPDRWSSWRPGGILAGLNVVRRFKPDAIWSTFPIATAHRIGAALSQLRKLPWVADFRDPMAQDGYPADPVTWRSFSNIEQSTVRQAAFSVFTTSGAARLYGERYPDIAERFVVIENGYDEASFSGLKNAQEPLNPGCLTLLHSGVIYPSERDPTHLFVALGKLKQESPSDFSKLVLRFRAPGCDDWLRQLADNSGISEQIEILPLIEHSEAIRELYQADGLLIAQASNSNAQIPGKFYEYVRSGKPILTLADPEGDTAKAATAAGISAVSPLDDTAAILGLLKRYILDPLVGTMPDPSAATKMSRRARTSELASVLRLAVSRPRRQESG